MIAAAKLIEENSIGISQSAVKVYLRMKVARSKVRTVDYIDG
jgi:predicted transcriptional regulator